MGFIDWFMGYALVWVLLTLCIAAACSLGYLAYLVIEERRDGSD